MVIMKNSHVMHLLVHGLKGRNILALQRSPIGVATIDILDLFPDFECTDSNGSKRVTVDLRKPSASQVKVDMKKSVQATSTTAQGAEKADDPDPVIGTISVMIERTCIEDLEQEFWTGLIQIVDWDDSGTLDQKVQFRIAPNCATCSHMTNDHYHKPMHRLRLSTVCLIRAVRCFLR